MPSPLTHNVFRATLVAAACAVALPAGAGIFRCTAADGSVSYQEMECADTEHTRMLDIPTQFPQVNSASRDNLFAREAELDRRLEAQRERDSREAVSRAMQPPEQPIPVADESAGYPIWWGPPLFQNPRPPNRPMKNPRPKVNPLNRGM
jgi:hypothetical protein